jgi:outer membrane receptor protein involved in Fe transport
MKIRLLSLCALLLCAPLFTPHANGQSIQGSIVGHVTDESGAAVPGAAVTVKNINTGATRDTVTNDEGLYRFSALPIGSYTVAVTKTGFGTSTVERVDVNVSADSTANIRLGAASLKEEVTVVAEGALLEAQQSQVAKVVDQRRIVELPMSGNSNYTLALLNPGVLPNQNGRPGSGFAVNGNRTRSNNFTLDGANNNDQSLQIARQTLPPTAIAEYQIITNTFAAEYGRNAGSYVNVITRSGTNEFHGIGFWEWGGNGVDALTTNQQRCFNSNRAAASNAGLSDKEVVRQCRSVEVRNKYGVSVGGPVVRNHTFFFGSADYEDFRTTISSASRVALSPAAVTLLQANAARFAPGHLNYLLTTFPTANDPTSQGSLTLRNLSVTCPSSDANCNVLGTLPLTTFNRGRTGGIPYGTDFDRYMAKINTKINGNDQLSFRYLFDDSKDPGSPTSIVGQEVGQNIRNHSFTVNDIYILTSNIINEARVTYARRQATFPENLGIAFSITGFGSVGNANFPQSRTDNMWEFTDNVAYTNGNHAMKFGYNLLRYDLNSFFAPNLRGTVSYGDINNFLFDRTASYQQYAGAGTTRAVTYEHSLFAQDDWRVNPDLTLNLGLRYEYVTAPFGFFSEAKPDINNFGPRVGFAYNPKKFMDGRFVLRAGFAISYDQIFQNILLNNSRNYPRGVNIALTNISGQSLFLNPPTPPDPEDFTGNPLLLPVRLFSPGERIKQPMSRQWTLGVQYQLGRDYVFKAEYIGTQGRNLVREVEVNYGFTTAAGGTGQRLDPTRGSILVSQGQADSIYHAGQFTFDKRFSGASLFGVNFGDFQLNANYTFSAFISESDDILGGQANRTLPADPRNPKLDRARSGFDQPHRFVASYIYNTPDVFKDSAVLNRILAGWQISGVTTLASGTPFSVLNANNALGVLPGQISTVELSQRVSVNPAGQYPLVSTPTAPNPNAYFIVNAANSGILGTLGANTERTGGTNRTDLALAKNIRTFGENQRLQLRLDAFNVFNRRNFTVIPTNTIGNTVNTDLFLNLGRTNVIGRGFTFGMRYYF